MITFVLYRIKLSRIWEGLEWRGMREAETDLDSFSGLGEKQDLGGGEGMSHTSQMSSNSGI